MKWHYVCTDFISICAYIYACANFYFIEFNEVKKLPPYAMYLINSYFYKAKYLYKCVFFSCKRVIKRPENAE